MQVLRWLVSILVLGLATAAAASSPGQSPRLARKALDARLDGPATEASPLPRFDLRQGGEGLQEQLIGLLPGQALEEVARTLASRQVQVQLSSDRAFVLVRVPLG